MGWGVADLFVGQPGRFSLAEAVHLNNQALIQQLATRFPKHAGVDFERFDLERDRKLMGRLAAQHGVRNRDALGLLWDRDTVAFYGDPAWDARLAPRPCAWEQSLTEKGGTFTFQVVAGKETKWRRPPMALLPWRVRGVEIIEGKELSPLVTDDFLLLPTPRTLEAGKRYRVVFRAERVAAGR
jgi:zinc protease